MPAISTDSKVLLTGGTGFLGAWILKSLLDEGLSVRAAVRFQSKADFLKGRFNEHLDKLEFVIVEDITAPGAFELAVNDVDGVIRAASPPSGPDPFVEPELLTKPAVEGTLGVLKRAQVSSRVKRIVITSSIAARVDIQPRSTLIIFTEADWDDQAVDTVTHNGKNVPLFAKYAASKTLAERSAWKWIAEDSPHFDLVTILPSFVLRCIGETGPDAMKAEYPTVNVHDVSRHHVLGLLAPQAGGERIISSNPTHSLQEFVNILHTNPVEGITLPAAQKLENWQAKVSVSNEKSRKILGAQYRSIEETVHDTVVGALVVGWTQ